MVWDSNQVIIKHSTQNNKAAVIETIDETEFLERWTDSSTTEKDAVYVLNFLKSGNTWRASEEDSNSEQVNAILKQRIDSKGDSFFMVEWSSPHGEKDAVSWISEWDMTNCQELVRLTKFKKLTENKDGSCVYSEPVVDYTKARLGSTLGDYKVYLQTPLAKSFGDLPNACLLYAVCELLHKIKKIEITPEIRQVLQTQLSITTSRGQRDSFARAEEILKPYSLVVTKCKKSRDVSWVDYLKSMTSGIFLCKTTTSLQIPAPHCFLVNCDTKNKRIYDLRPRHRDLVGFRDFVVCVRRVAPAI
jgi:hypothetical protein